MPTAKKITPLVLKDGTEIITCYCRKCMKNKPHMEFYNAVDNYLVDSNSKFSVCKDCIQKLYDLFFIETGSLEKSIHKICQALNVKYSNECADATKKHLQTISDSGKNIKSIFGVFLMKIVATNKSMDKSLVRYNGYEDIGTIFTEKQIDITIIPIPKEVVKFWGNDLAREDIEYLENEYANFKTTHSATTHAEVVLLKQTCFTMLSIKKARLAGDPTDKLVKELQDLMKNLAISPNVVNANSANKGADSFGLWIEEIEKEEPCVWMRHDPRADIFRDTTEDYFQKYIVRSLKNFLLQSKDFNVDESNIEDDFEVDPDVLTDFPNIDDGNVN